MANILDFPNEALLEGQAIPSSLIISLDQHAETLRPDFVLQKPDDSQPRLLIQLYEPDQKLDKVLKNRRWVASPQERMRQLLILTKNRLGLITNGEHWQILHVPSKADEPTSYVSWYSATWLEEPITLRAFQELVGSYRFFNVPDGDTLEGLFADSANNHQEVTDQLGYQVRRAVETLVQAIDQADKDSQRQLLANSSHSELYQAVLTVMMRLVFLMSAEERKMLPLDELELYDKSYAVSTLGIQLRQMADQNGEEILERRYDAWSRLLATFRLVYDGSQHPSLFLLAYGGELFDPDRYPFLEGRAVGTQWQTTQAIPLPINNRTVLHLLEALQLLEVKVTGGSAEKRRLSFRALDIEQIGHVYEGLLDHTALQTPEPVLGLKGNRDHEAEIPLVELEKQAAKGQTSFLAYLKEQTNRTPNALQKDLALQLNPHEKDLLRGVCDNDEALYKRVLPFAGIIRNDSFGRAVVITTGSVYVTQGTDRRTTGTHYTPRSLTEPLVKYTLEPLVYEGPAEGWPESEWQLHSPIHLLNLKICDMAMGSGAFLVEVCRYLAKKLVQAWDNAEQKLGIADNQERYTLTISGRGVIGKVGHDEELVEGDHEERLTLARRLVAERCLYGVDKNPMAVEMAKLSLWLTTLDKNRPFTFLNHALRGGDSLLGVNLKQLKNWSMKDERQIFFKDFFIGDAYEQALKLRRRIKQMPVNGDAKLNAEKKRLQKEAEEAISLLKLGADLLIAETLADMKPDIIQRDAHFLHYGLLIDVYNAARVERFTEKGREEQRQAFAPLRTEVDKLLNSGDPLKGRHPYHWPLEFPEAFDGDNPGFDALVGNPPFQGGKKITGVLGTDYRDYLINYLADGKRGNADLCAYFFLRVNDITSYNGQAGLLATNTIAQGDTREVGLDQMVANGWVIPRAVSSRKWPGTANLEVSHIWLRHGHWNSCFWLEDVCVLGITPLLTRLSSNSQGNPLRLIANASKAFIGSYLLGMGFIVEPQEAQALIDKDQRNKDVLFPYLNGEDLNSRPDQSSSRWAINFHNWSLEKAETYSDCLTILRNRVAPQRAVSSKFARKEWWLYQNERPGLYSAIAGLRRVLILSEVSSYLPYAWHHTNIVFSHMLIVWAVEESYFMALLQSSIHRVWTLEYASTLGKGIRYTPSDCFVNFPFPTNPESLNDISEQYSEYRQSIMLERQEGLTKTYNRFHKEQEQSGDIVRLRELHRGMDRLVAQSYGWQDLDLEHGFHQTKQGLRYTISETARREVLDRLLTLNHQRYAEEVAAGLHDKGKGKGKSKPKKARSQPVANTTSTVSHPPMSPTTSTSTNLGQGQLFEVEQKGGLWEWHADNKEDD